MPPPLKCASCDLSDLSWCSAMGGDAITCFLHCWPSAGWAGFTREELSLGWSYSVKMCILSIGPGKPARICSMFPIVGVVGITVSAGDDQRRAVCLALLMHLLPACGTELMASVAHRVVLFWVLLWVFLTCRKCFVTKKSLNFYFQLGIWFWLLIR